MNIDQLAARLQGLSLGAWRYVESASSTNDVAQQWAQSGAPDFSLIWADQQTSGRGRLQHSWYSQPGASLTFSLIFHPTPAEISYLTHFVALGAVSIAQVLRERYSLPAKIKWPNDVLVERKKVCGILVENSWLGDQLQSVVMGIGINVALGSVPPIDQQAYPAASLEGLLGLPLDRLDLLCELLSALQTWRKRLCSDDLLDEWEAHLAFKNEWVTVLQADGTLRRGKIIGLTEQGNLRLADMKGQEWSALTGEVRLG